MTTFVRFTFLSLVLVALCAVSALAQSTTTGAINGTVTNPNKEVVAGATVTVKNKGTNKEDTATTDDNGGFKVNNLQPGTYAVTINGSGFAPYTNENVVVEVGRSTTMDTALSLVGVTGTVQVTAEAPAINTTQQDFSSNVNQVSLNNLPSNGRRWSNFAILTPGAVPDGTFGLISFRGISGLLNNSTIDGGDNNQAFFSEERGRTRIGYVISQAAIREYQVNTSNYSAEYGRSAGGVINAVTKSGTNQFHGEGFLFDRNNKWGARNPRSFVTQLIGGVATPVAYKAPDVRYQYGGALGGPIVKDKAFFFFSYDEQRRNFPGVAVFSVPSYLSTVNNATLTARGLTTAQINSSLNFLTSLTGPTPRRGNQRLILPKLDWRITSNNTLTVAYNRLRWASPAGVQTAATVTRDINGFGDDFVRSDGINVRLASTISSRLVNEGRFQYSRELDSQFAQPALPGEPTTANGFSPQVALSNGLTFGKSTGLDRRALPDERRYQFADTLTYSPGKHTFKFGADINHLHEIYDELFTEAGSYSYSNINDFIVDYTNFTSGGALRAAGTICATAANPIANTRLAGKCYTSNYAQGFGPARFEFPTNDYAFFLQDDWRVTSRLTLNLGLRYEYEQLPTPFAALINPALPQTANRPSDKNNFGPRLGFALDVKGDGKMSIRGGWGIYYGRINGSAIVQALINTSVPGQSQIVASVPANCSATLCPGAATNPAGNPAAPIFPNILPSAPLGTATVNYFASNFQNPMIQQGDLVFERQVARNTVISASYLFSFGKYLPNFVDTNLSPPTAVGHISVVDGPFAGVNWVFPYYLGNRPNAAFGQVQEIRSDISTKYNALVLQANRRLTNGLQFQTNYTLSLARDNGQNSQTFTPGFSASFDPFNQSGESGLSNFDRRHKFVASVVYNTSFKGMGKTARTILGGWTIAPVVNMFSGARYTGVTNSFSTSSTFGFSQNGGVNGANGSLRFAYLPNNFFHQPPIKYVDMRISRRFTLKENYKIELLAEGFNIFNRTQVTSVNTQIYSLCTGSGTTGACPFGTGGVFATYVPSFGTTSGADGFFFKERQIQLGVRFEF
ncbi:MAG TPA: TonB-dependent receptor [Pyrinomonadaceae bacterium]|nr:TonB-dependent receptor [Pyrinomonadaceae bacterium]